MKNIPDEPVLSGEDQTDPALEKATPLRCFFAASLSGAIAYCCYLLLTSIVHTYGAKAVTSSNPIVINLTAAVRTMVMGIVALGTGVFGVVAVGLLLLGIQVTVRSFKKA
ncbi:MAG: DUF3082 domain-containing protein [Cyanobacteria bacterium J06607_15]